MAKKPTKSSKSKAKKPDPNKKARVHKELEGFEIGVNPLGEITSNYSIEQINQFLGRHVRDKKLVDRAGQFGEHNDDEENDEDFLPDANASDSEDDLIQQTKSEAKRGKKPAASDEDETDEAE